MSNNLRKDKIESHQLIRITHFINPHMFWYQFEKSMIQNNKLYKLQREIEDFYHAEQTVDDKKTYKPKIGEVVGVFVVSWLKWIRARVEKIEYDEVILWAIDNGIPLKINEKWIRPLQEHLATQNVDAVFFGGVSDIVPAEMGFDLVKGLPERKIQRNWSKTAVNQFEALIKESAEIRFFQHYDCNNHLFGSLEFVTFVNTKFNLGEVLINIGQAMKSAKFLIDLKLINSTNIPWYNNNDNNLSSSIMKANSHMLESRKKNSEPNYKSNVEVPKVAQLNYESNVKVSEVAQSNFEKNIKFSEETLKSENRNKSLNEIENDFNDLDFEDSVSVITESKQQRQKISPYVDDYFYTGCGSSNISKIRAANKLPLRFVNLSSYSPTEKPSSSVVSELSSIPILKRSSEIFAQRRRLMGNQLTGEEIIPSGYDLQNRQVQTPDNINYCKHQEINSHQMESKNEDTKLPTEQQNLDKVDLRKYRGRVQKSKTSTIKCEIGNSINVLVNGENIPTPIEKLAEAKFLPNIFNEFERKGLKQIFRMQTYSWPHLLNGDSIVIINSGITGKTLGYIPSLFSSVTTCEGVGPIAIIICTSSTEISALYHLCKSFNKNENSLNIIKANGFRDHKKFVHKLLNGCDILITSPKCLTRLLESSVNLFEKNRIKHLVVDNIDLMIEHFKEDLENIFKRCTSFTKEGVISQQLIITSKYWYPYLLTLIKNTMNPIIIIGAYIEAAVYAKANISLKLQPKNDKCNVIYDYISKLSCRWNRTIIICSNSEEVKEVSLMLNSKSIFNISCHEESNDCELELAQEWNRHQEGTMQVLVCSDFVLDKLKITMAENVIHYSLSKSWTKFSYRFSTIFGNIPDILKNETKKAKPNIIILLDETNNEHLPKLIDFLKIHNPSSINSYIQNLVNKIRIELEELKGISATNLCKYFLEFGKCYKQNNCKDRHLFIKSDKLSDGCPTEGIVQLEILSVESPTLYTARLLSVKDKNNKWKPFPQSQEYSTFILKMLQYYLSNPKCPNHYPIQIQDICTYSNDDSYQRCQILKIEDKRLGFQIIYIRCIDSGSEIICKSTDLLVLPDELKLFPPQAFDVRLSGLVPFDFDNEWDKETAMVVENWLLQEKKSNSYIQATIEFGIDHMLWVNSLIVVEHLDEINTNILGINIKKNLIAKNFALFNPKPINELMNAALECGIIESNKIISDEGSTFNNNHEIKKESAIESCTSSKTTSITSSEKRNFENDETNMKIIATEKKFFTKVNSKINKKKDEYWAVLEENCFEKIFMGNYVDPDKFFVVKYSYHEAMSLLYEEMKEYGKTVKNLKIITLGRLCIIKHEERFFRGKICEIDNDEIIVFFCDTGDSMAINIDDIYEISDHLLQLPFQSIQCKLVGIKPKGTEDWSDKIFDLIDNNNEFLYVRQFIPHYKDGNCNDSTSSNINEVVLIDGSKENNIVINKLIIEKGLGEYDLDTEYFLDIYIPPSLNKNFNEDEPNIFHSNDNEFDFEIDSDDMDSFMGDNDIDNNIEEGKIEEINKNSPEWYRNDVIQADQNTEIIAIPDESLKLVTNDLQVPRLIFCYPYPNVTWHQNNSFVYLIISATDILDYKLKVTVDSLLMRLIFEDKLKSVCINFIGCIEPLYTLHEIHGLNIHIRLVKLIKGMAWPSLTIEPDKNHKWLKYNFNHLSEEENIFSMYNQTCTLRCPSASDYSSDNEDCFESDDDLKD